MKATASDVLVETLLAWGVDTVFGIPGDGINGIIEAFRKRQDRIRFIQVRHEEAAAFMACGYAKFTGRLGVCVATSGPGGIHLLNGLYDAKLDGVPVLAITGLQFHDLLNTETQQDVELDKLFMDVCKYNNRIMGPAHIENVVELACRTALAYRGVAHVTMPVDMQEMPIDEMRSKRNRPHHVSDIWAESAHIPTDAAIRKAAELLNAAQEAGHHRRPRRARRPQGTRGDRRDPRRADRQAAARQGLRARTTAPTRRAASACSARGRRRTRSKAATRC